MKKRIHFIGIGGIGVSALAKYYLKKGWRVSGSDLAASEITLQMQDMGAKVHIGKPKGALITKGVKRVIYSPAAQKNHPERVAARRKKIPELSYPQALGELTRQHVTIAVSGTHGKSTTTSMLGVLLTKAGLDPTVIVGTKLKEFGNSTLHHGGHGEGSNCRVGESKYLVIEADEYADSFLNYHPQIAVLTSLEADHLDYFKTFQNMQRSFKKYLGRVEKRGVVIANKDDKNIRNLLRGHKGKVVWYSQKDKEKKKVQAVLQIPGKHNVQNGLAALKVSAVLGIPQEKALKALLQYKGSWRRFEIFKLKKPRPYTLVSDYGHHPTEIKVTMAAAKEKWPQKDIWLIYQPHQYQRTYYLFEDFVNVLSRVPVQKLLLLDIYDVAGREEGSIRKQVSSAKLLEAVKKKKPLFEALLAPGAREAQKYLAQNLRGGEIVVVMGAGDIYQNLTLQLTRSL